MLHLVVGPIVGPYPAHHPSKSCKLLQHVSIDLHLRGEAGDAGLPGDPQASDETM